MKSLAIVRGPFDDSSISRAFFLSFSCLEEDCFPFCSNNIIDFVLLVSIISIYVVLCSGVAHRKVFLLIGFFSSFGSLERVEDLF